MTQPDVKLPRNADELLADFPVPEPDFEAQATAIQARLQPPVGPHELPDAALFGAPELAPEPNEPPLPSQVRAAPQSYFADMARRSLHKPDEDAAALAKELLAAASQVRRPNPELVQRVRAAGRSAPTATPLPLSEPRAERSSGVVPRAEGTAQPPSAVDHAKTSDKRGVVIALAGIGVAAAAALVLFVGGTPEGSPSTATLAAERASEAGPSAPEVAAPSTRTAPPSERVLSPDALPATPVARAASAAGTEVAKPSVIAAAKVKARTAPSSLPQPTELPEDATPRVAAAEPKVEAPEPALLPAQGSHGSVPLNPSSGAVSTALGSVRSGAQACLAGQTEAMTATVTFASDGHVLRVNAGGPSGACVVAALSKAKIAPFAKESFSATTTIRPP